MDHLPLNRLEKQLSKEISHRPLNVLKSMDALRNNTDTGIINKIGEIIAKYEENHNKYALTVENVHNRYKEFHLQLEQFKKNNDNAYNILVNSRSVLETYKRLRDDDQSYQENLKDTDETINECLGELHKVREKLADIKKREYELYKVCEDTQETMPKLSSAPEEFKEIGEVVNSQPEKLHSVQKELNGLTNRKYELQTFYKNIQENMNKLLITPTDKVFIQYKEHLLRVYEEMEIMRNRIVVGELPKYTSQMTSGAHESVTASLPVAQIAQLLGEVKQTQTDLVSDSPESQKKVEILVKNIRKLHKDATAIEQNLDDYNTVLEDISKECNKYLEKLEPLKKKFEPYIDSSVYNPYYSMKDAHIDQCVDVNPMLPNSCAVMAARWGLSKLGIDIHSNATEEEIAKRVNFQSEIGGTYISNTPNAYRHYGYDYIHISAYMDMEKEVTIETIDSITKLGHAVHVGVEKPEIGGHVLLIEGVTNTEDGHHITLFDPWSKQIVTLPYKELEKVLTHDYTLPSDEQMKTREPILKDINFRAQQPSSESGAEK